MYTDTRALNEQMSYSAEFGNVEPPFNAAAPEIILGSAGAKLTLRVLRRLNTESTDYWDGNWLVCRASASAGAFSGIVEAELRTDELQSFAEGLDELHGRLTGDAVLASMDFWIDVVVTGDGLGHFSAECWLRDQPGFGNRLEFQVTFDQTEIPAIVSALRETLATFPVVGSPHSS